MISKIWHKMFRLDNIIISITQIQSYIHVANLKSLFLSVLYTSILIVIESKKLIKCIFFVFPSCKHAIKIDTSYCN